MHSFLLTRLFRYASFLIIFCAVIHTYAQKECGQTALEEAQKQYEVGRFDDLITMIDKCLETGFTTDEQIQAYRLLTLAYIAKDDFEAATLYAENILELNSGFTPNVLFDPPQFIGLIDRIKKPVTSLVTASRQLEPLQEAPVPVTVITRQMIESSGARNLKELLVIYVPGMTAIEDHNELNVSMHGVYASSQQKILILLNGHRLNSRAYSEANPDFSISLEKIRQIEVLRGPASSLYGNVALTSVINIITKSGQDVSGTELLGGIGNNRQQKATLLYGERYDKSHDLFLWANYYRSGGEKIFIPAAEDHSPNPKDGFAIMGGIKDKPSYDLGLVFQGKNVSFMVNSRYCKYIEPFSGGGVTGEVYDYGAFRTFLGTGPGLGSGSTHLDAKFNREIKKNYEILANAYLDFNHIDVNLVINPANNQSGKVYWNENSYGFVTQLKKEYQFNHLGRGNVIAGIQVDRMKLIDSFYLLGTDGQIGASADSMQKPILEKGEEGIYSGFLQLKHRIGKKWIVNIGGRYDFKQRHKGHNIDNFSPRMSLIFLPGNRFDMRLSYAQSFVDAPYWYRYNSLPSYKGAENLLPEYLTSLQLSLHLSALEDALNCNFNIFYNRLRDFIYRVPEASGDEPRYENAGRLESAGIEGEIHYTSELIRLHGNLAWQYAISAMDYGVTGREIHNVPQVSGNFVFDINPLYKLTHKTWLNLTAMYTGKQRSPVSCYLNGQPFVDPEFSVDPAIILNAGIHITDIWGFQINTRIYNFFDTKYYQGGSVNFPYPQQGRWYMIELGYKW